MSLPVSVLDLVGMRTEEPAGSAIARSVDLARHTEGWGYRRYWLAEHHSIPGLACSATSVLIGHYGQSILTSPSRPIRGSSDALPANIADNPILPCAVQGRPSAQSRSPPAPPSAFQPDPAPKQANSYVIR